jgi:hypothetical protein
MKVTVDGVEQSEKIILLADDGNEHKVEVWDCRKLQEEKIFNGL